MQRNKVNSEFVHVPLNMRDFSNVNNKREQGPKKSGSVVLITFSNEVLNYKAIY